MSLISVNNLTFAYEGSFDNIFENASFQIDTNWRLGFIGRNGRGKTTFLKLLMGEYEYTGEITASVAFDYFPPPIQDTGKTTIEIMRSCIAPFEEMEYQMESLATASTQEAMEQYGEVLEKYSTLDGFTINELIIKETNKLQVDESILYRSFKTLSGGERTKCLLAALFLKKDNFLLIDEPTNHLDFKGRQVISDYLKSKKSFIVVSHDRIFLDTSIDHVLSINKGGIEVMQGNFRTWKENRDRTDAFELAQNEKLKKDIVRLKTTARQMAQWSDKIESSKIGTHVADRGYVGHKAAKMMKRSKSAQRRMEDAAEEKSGLLKNIEAQDELKLTFAEHHAKLFIKGSSLSLYYGQTKVLESVDLTLSPGDRLAVRGVNGSGKTSLIKFILGENIEHTGDIFIAKGLKFSYVSQDTSHLRGGLTKFCQDSAIDEFLFKSILRKMGFERVQFEKTMENYSEGQKKKVLLARSLCEKAHIYIWDEPLNFIDIISRLQIEELIMKYKPTMIFVEHDMAFNKNVATASIDLK